MKNIKNVKAGDKIQWNDPDEGTCSNSIVVKSIEDKGDLIAITGEDEEYIECYLDEIVWIS